MDINNELDQNAADLRNVAEAQLPQAARAEALTPPKGLSQRNVSKVQVILAVVILIGVVLGVWIFLQKQTASRMSVSIPVNQPLAPPSQSP